MNMKAINKATDEILSLIRDAQPIGDTEKLKDQVAEIVLGVSVDTQIHSVSDDEVSFWERFVIGRMSHPFPYPSDAFNTTIRLASEAVASRRSFIESQKK